MVITVVSMAVKGISGKFLSVDQKIISPGLFSTKSQMFQRPLDHCKLPVQIVMLSGNEKGEIQISKIVVDGSAP